MFYPNHSQYMSLSKKKMIWGEPKKTSHSKHDTTKQMSPLHCLMNPPTTVIQTIWISPLQQSKPWLVCPTEKSCVCVIQADQLILTPTIGHVTTHECR